MGDNHFKDGLGCQFLGRQEQQGKTLTIGERKIRAIMGQKGKSSYLVALTLFNIWARFGIKMGNEQQLQQHLPLVHIHLI